MHPDDTCQAVPAGRERAARLCHVAPRTELLLPPKVAACLQPHATQLQTLYRSALLCDKVKGSSQAESYGGELTWDRVSMTIHKLRENMKRLCTAERDLRLKALRSRMSHCPRGTPSTSASKNCQCLYRWQGDYGQVNSAQDLSVALGRE